MSPRLAVLVLVALCACDPPPEFDAVAGDPLPDGPAPALLPVDQVLAAAARASDAPDPIDEVEKTEARVAALQARAAALSAEEVVDDASRATMDGALERRLDQ